MTETIFPMEYVKSVLGARDEVLNKVLKQSLLQDKLPPIQVDDNAGRVLQILTMLYQPKNVLEVGALFGYSAIHIARGLPENGMVTAIEIDPTCAEIARRNIDYAGLSAKARVLNADALQYLQSLADESVDMLFIDGEKQAYPDYLKKAFSKVRHGGLVIADDAFAVGIYDADEAAENEAEVIGIKTYNRAVGKSPRFFSAFIGTEHGLMVSIKS